MRSGPCAADFRQAELAAVLGSPTMGISGLMGSVEAVRRKLRIVAAVVEDRGASLQTPPRDDALVLC